MPRPEAAQTGELSQLDPFADELVSRHIDRVLEGKEAIDDRYVQLAGGFARFEQRLDHAENARIWRARRPFYLRLSDWVRSLCCWPPVGEQMSDSQLG